MLYLSEFAANRPAMLLNGDIRKVAALLPDQSIAMIATSPPYYALRDYRTATDWKGGNHECDHLEPGTNRGKRKELPDPPSGWAGRAQGKPYGKKCGKCGAKRRDMQMGSESTPEAYIAGMVDMFRELRRSLRDDGTFWLNLGDSYGDEKQLQGMPWRVALALQADGWYLRADIIWHKPSPMPESCKDRPSRAHEYVFLFSKSPDYYYDWFAVREAAVRGANHAFRSKRYTGSHSQKNWDMAYEGTDWKEGVIDNPTRNLRTVWTISTESFKGAHFATFPLALVEPMIKAGSSEYGYCGACGKPYVRNVEARRRATRPGKATKVGDNHTDKDIGNRDPERHVTDYIDKGFHASCPCAFPAHPGIVLDPFVGSGTTVAAAVALGRYGLGIDLSREYLSLARERIGGALTVRDSEHYLPKIEKV